jgi:hypothetical protein
MRFLFLGLSMFYFYGGAPPVSYDGDNMLAVLGQNRSSPTFKNFSKFWTLNADNENKLRGIKVRINPIADTVESIVIAANGNDFSDSKLTQSPVKLPLEISFEDDTTALINKLGRGEKMPGSSTMKFCKENVCISATYADFKQGKMISLKFSTEVDRSLPVRVIETPPVVKKESRADKTHQLEKAIFLSPVDTQTNASPAIKEAKIISPFKKAILDVFKASRDSSFNVIKADARTEGNFWNYKYTYGTNLKVPGEKYNMLYSFPFITSQLDFVVVLKESDNFEKSFASLYHNFEKQLTDNLPESEGWIATCLPGKDKSHLPDLEFRNDKYGAVILDHTQNPWGKHVLYLRFLLFAD